MVGSIIGNSVDVAPSFWQTSITERPESLGLEVSEESVFPNKISYLPTVSSRGMTELRIDINTEGGL